MASALAWVENKLNLTNTYSGVASGDDHPFGYVIPFSPNYTATMQAHWTTDIIVLEPSCNWQTTSTTGVVDVNLTGAEYWSTTLPEANLNITLSSDSFGMFYPCCQDCSCTIYLLLVPTYPTLGSITAKASVAAPPYYNTTGTTRIVSSDGSVVFVLSQLDHQVVDPQVSPNPSHTISPTTDLSNIPTLQFSNGNVLAFLLCSPHASIQTRQVRATGNGIFTLGKQQPSLGNLDPDQTNYILSSVLTYLATGSGPLQEDVGTEMMVHLIFGDNFQAFSNTPPAPLTNITAVYNQVIQSAMKTLVSGTFGTANVTGGSAKAQVVFRSSLGHVVISAVLFSLLTMALVVVQFRKGQDGFTFINVAAELADSDAPKKCMEMKESVSGGEGKILRLVPSADGGQNCIRVFD